MNKEPRGLSRRVWYFSLVVGLEGWKVKAPHALKFSGWALPLAEATDVDAAIFDGAIEYS